MLWLNFKAKDFYSKVVCNFCRRHLCTYFYFHSTDSSTLAKQALLNVCLAIPAHGVEKIHGLR